MNDLKLIKKYYGEKMMHLCRELFPSLLEQEGLLSKLLLNKFEPSRFLYEDIIESGNIEGFKNYIYRLIDVENNHTIEVTKTPKELLEEAEYILYECKTEDDIQRFRKYYYRKGGNPVYTGGVPKRYEGEELCTFNGGRLNYCYVFFAVKKNVDDIRKGDMGVYLKYHPFLCLLCEAIHANFAVFKIFYHLITF